MHFFPKNFTLRVFGPTKHQVTSVINLKADVFSPKKIYGVCSRCSELFSRNKIHDWLNFEPAS